MWEQEAPKRKTEPFLPPSVRSCKPRRGCKTPLRILEGKLSRSVLGYLQKASRAKAQTLLLWRRHLTLVPHWTPLGKFLKTTEKILTVRKMSVCTNFNNCYILLLYFKPLIYEGTPWLLISWTCQSHVSAKLPRCKMKPTDTILGF